MNKLAIVATVAAATVVVFMFWGKIIGFIHRDPELNTTVFVPDPKSDKRIVASGWTDDELKKILEDFAKLYELDRSFATRVKSVDSDNVLVSFPNDIPSDVFFFLVNYLNYPERYELSGRQIAVAGKVTLTPTFDLPEPSLAGKAAKVYVPADDQDFDLVYVVLPSGERYEVSFTDHRWKRVEEARMSRAVREL